ncbi:ABC transporter permease [Deinococcus humi]|uniref:ABC-type dipeptide/oligopeptide/nickel transport system permease component n=1 Tax=Deinococcus humi TaxID=662880 RepID=A0A7W8JXH6_9DEIO|nr:ABC transporter permease [Deinococcus humi]MBB5363768.1 ABC-type dipeptide/oligopeptide/nickel transport system permease component [Deinococcus humi]GGO32066.1 peptide ABC transporter permease [Deinococcus humi]
MIQYVLGRLVGTVPVLLGVTVLVFLLLKFVPGDPVVALLGEEAQGMSAQQLDKLREAYGFTDPWVVQYGRFLQEFVTGKLLSLRTETPVLTEILQRFPYTLQLTAVALGLSVLVAIPLGIAAAVRRDTRWDHLITTISLLGISIPSFWFAIMIMLLFALQLRWLPPSGSGTPAHLVMPALTLAFGTLAIQIRMMRASLLETLPQDYVRTARAKGLAPRQVLRHALRNALIPVVTVIGLEFGSLLGGAAITESIFAWPGLGRLTLDAVISRDIPLVQGVVVFAAVVFTLVNLTVDLLYGLLNPRVQYG